MSAAVYLRVSSARGQKTDAQRPSLKEPGQNVRCTPRPYRGVSADV